MPASRSARAITFAPRSWPSSPGLAMTTRMGRSVIHGNSTAFGIRPSAFGIRPSAFANLQPPTFDLLIFQHSAFRIAAVVERSELGAFHVLAPHVAQGVADLADGGMSADGFD